MPPATWGYPVQFGACMAETLTCWKSSQTHGGALGGVPAEGVVICTVARPSLLSFHVVILQGRLRHGVQGYNPATGGLILNVVP